MQKEKEEIIERIAKLFPRLEERDKYFVAGYISKAEEPKKKPA